MSFDISFPGWFFSNRLALDFKSLVFNYPDAIFPSFSFISKLSSISPTTGCFFWPRATPPCIYNFPSPLPISVIAFPILVLLLESPASISGVGSMVQLESCFAPGHYTLAFNTGVHSSLLSSSGHSLLKHNDLIFFSLRTWPHFDPWTLLHYGWHYLWFSFCPSDMLKLSIFPSPGSENTDCVFSTTEAHSFF